MRRCYVKLTVFYRSPNKLFLSGIFSDMAIMPKIVIAHLGMLVCSDMCVSDL